MAMSRFEVRSCRTGALEASHREVVTAIAYAETIRREFAETFFVVDLHLAEIDEPGDGVSPGGDGVIWRDGKIAPSALESMRRSRAEARETVKNEAFAAFMRREGDASRAFMNRHASDDFSMSPGSVSYAREYRCECGFRTGDPRAIFEHVCAAKVSP